MSVKRWLVIDYDDEIEKADKRSNYGECWFHSYHSDIFPIDFGDARDIVADTPLDSLCEKLSEKFATEKNLLELKRLWVACSSLECKEKGWEKIISKSNPNKQIYFYCE